MTYFSKTHKVQKHREMQQQRASCERVTFSCVGGYNRQREREKRDGGETKVVRWHKDSVNRARE